MKRSTGLDVSLSTTTICVVDEQGQGVFEGSVVTDPDLLAAVRRTRQIWLGWKPMSEWFHAGLSRQGLETVLMETRYVLAALKPSLVKTDRRDAHGIARLLRMGGSDRST